MAQRELTRDQATQLAEIFHLLGDANRLRLVYTCLEEAVSVQDLADRLELSASLVSHHLRLLKAARLMRSERRGRQVFYVAADEHIRSVLCDMTEHMDEDED